MKYSTLVMSLLLSTNAWSVDYNKYKPYTSHNINSDQHRAVMAKQRATAHPKGSGVGTNKYNIRYDKSYKVRKYTRD